MQTVRVTTATDLYIYTDSLQQVVNVGQMSYV